MDNDDRERNEEFKLPAIKGTLHTRNSKKNTKKNVRVKMTSSPLLRSNSTTQARPLQKKVGEKKQRKRFQSSQLKSNSTEHMPIKYKYAILPGNNSRAVIAAFRSRPWWGKASLQKPSEEGGHTARRRKPHSAPAAPKGGKKGQAEPQEWDLLWEMYRNPRRVASVSPNSRQALNHFDNNSCLVTKKGLYRSLKAYCQATGKQLEELIPLTFYLKRSETDDAKEEESQDRKEFCDTCQTLNQENHDSEGTFWIVKPASLSNRGMGIQLAGSEEEVLAIVDQRNTSGGSDRRRFGWIVQKYMMNPLLVHGRKFDIRCWVLLLARPEPSRRGQLEGFFFREGYIRTSSVKYNKKKKNMKNRYMHLTNDAVQKNSSEYGKYEPGNKLSFEEFQAYLDETYPDKHGYVEEVLLPKIKRLTATSIAAVSSAINKSQRKYCFELLGYDFMMDDDFNTFLIEVNSNPCLEFSSPMLEDYITCLLQNVVETAIDTLFPPPKKYQRQPSLSYTLRENKLELIFSSEDVQDCSS